MFRQFPNSFGNIYPSLQGLGSCAVSTLRFMGQIPLLLELERHQSDAVKRRLDGHPLHGTFEESTPASFLPYRSDGNVELHTILSSIKLAKSDRTEHIGRVMSMESDLPAACTILEIKNKPWRVKAPRVPCFHYVGRGDGRCCNGSGNHAREKGTYDLSRCMLCW